MTRLDASLAWKAPGASPFGIEVELSVGEEILILFGPSGAGKSTVLRLLAGLVRPARGHVRLGGTTLFDSISRRDLPLRDRRIGMIWQDDLLFPHRDVAGNVGFGLARWSRAEAARRVEEVSGLCGVGHLLGRRPETLSGGERQRVGLARALAPRPRLLLCDEPVSALDLPSRDLLLDGLRAVAEAERIPVVYVTHSPPEAISVGSRLLRLDRGRVADEGPPLDVLARSAAKLSGIENRFSATVVDIPVPAGETRLSLDGGPSLLVPGLGRAAGSRVVVRVRADEIILAPGPVSGLSARNVVPGIVARVVVHEDEAEVVVATGEVEWVASVVAPAAKALGLCPGLAVHMIIKARSCRVVDLRPPGR